MTASASIVLHAGAALLCFALSVLVLVTGRDRTVVIAGRGRAALWLASVCAAASVWAGIVALTPLAPLNGLAGMAETLRAGMGFLLLLVLYRRIGGAEAAATVRRFGLVGLLLFVVALVSLLPSQAEALVLPTLGSPLVLMRLGLAFATVLLAENLYRNADETARWHVNLPCIALGALAVIDILLYADAVLSRRFSVEMIDARAVLTPFALALLVVAAARGRRLHKPLRMSREAVFHGATLVIGGAFLIGIGIAGEALRQLGGDWTRAAQISLLAGAALAVTVAAASQSVRSRIRHLVIGHFFAGRYDYRREWLRCVDTLAGDDAATEAPVRAIRAIADPVDSPSGALLLREALEQDPKAPLVWSGSWNMPSPALSLPPTHPLVAALRGGEWVSSFADTPAPADIAAAFGQLWLAVPLLHHREGLLGIVLLGPPRAPFTPDKEAYDLLRTLGQEVAMFLAERRTAEYLADQRQLQEYAKRFAFVAHDVKTVSSQLSLLLANAEENIEDPEFQRDMLLTVRASADRINTLIARLRRPEAEGGKAEGGKAERAIAPAGTPPTAPTPQSEGAEASPDDDKGGEDNGIEGVAVLAQLSAIAAARRHPVTVSPAGSAAANADGDSHFLAAIGQSQFDEAVTHLLDNAIEASEPGVPVRIAVEQHEEHIVIDITDRGPGMTPEFVRDTLFRPLGTSKPHGSGIGAWQARELLREAGGDLTVMTRPGSGTTMRLTLRRHDDAPTARRLSA